MITIVSGRRFLCHAALLGNCSTLSQYVNDTNLIPDEAVENSVVTREIKPPQIVNVKHASINGGNLVFWNSRTRKVLPLQLAADLF